MSIPTTLLTPIRGGTAFIKGKIDSILTAMNTDLAANVVGGDPVQFVTGIGRLLGTDRPTINVWHSSMPPPTRMAQYNKNTTDIFFISAYLPEAGPDTAMAFEMASQISKEWVRYIFLDDGQVLKPIINCGSFGNVRAYEAETGAQLDLFPTKLGDNTSVLHGWEMMYAITINVDNPFT